MMMRIKTITFLHYYSFILGMEVIFLTLEFTVFEIPLFKKHMIIIFVYSVQYSFIYCVCLKSVKKLLGGYIGYWQHEYSSNLNQSFPIL